MFTVDQKGTASVHQILCQSWESATETVTMIQHAFGDQILSRTQVFQWHAGFMTGRTSADDDENKGRPTSCKTPETVTRIKSSSVRIDVVPFPTLLRIWELVMGHANGF
jgi:hypothetical protein